MTGTAYVARGDSISIDDYSGGPGRGGASLLFRNRDEDVPAWRGRDLERTRPGSGFALLATDGATTRTLLDVQRLRAAGLRPALVTVTTGGNDLLSSYGDTPTVRQVIRSVAGGGAAVAEVAERFHGHGVLAGDVRTPQARPASRDLWSCSVIEPNAWGADGVRSAFWAALGGEAAGG